MNYINFKDYIGRVDYDGDAEIFYGEVINTRDVITFQGSTVKELKKSFIDSVEDYIAFCEARGEEPEKPFSGKFNLRLTPDLHREVYLQAKKVGVSLNDWVRDSILHSLSQKSLTTVAKKIAFAASKSKPVVKKINTQIFSKKSTGTSKLKYMRFKKK